MPIMTEPLAHVESLLDDTRHQIECLNIERLKLEAKISVLGEQRWAIQKALDEERKKRTSAAEVLHKETK